MIVDAGRDALRELQCDLLRVFARSPVGRANLNDGKEDLWKRRGDYQDEQAKLDAQAAPRPCPRGGRRGDGVIHLSRNGGVHVTH